MSGKIEPLTEADIVAARVRAAEGGVPWNREQAIEEAIKSAAVKRAEREAEASRLAQIRKKRRQRTIMAATAAALLLLACLWLLIRR